MGVARSVAAPGGRTAAVAAAVAIGLHAAALVAIDRWSPAGPRVETQAARTDAPPSSLVTEPMPPAPVTTVALIGDLPDGLHLAAIPGAGDQAGTGDQHPLPDAPLDSPGVRPAAPGGGDTGGSERLSEQRDRSDGRAELWNDDHRYRSPRHAGTRPGGAQPLRRSPSPGFDARARAPSRAHHAGVAAGRGTEAEPRATGVESALAAPPGVSPTLVRSGSEGVVSRPGRLDPAEAAAGSDGRPRNPARASALLARTGPPTASGPTPGNGDRQEVAAVSDALDPLPLEWVAAASGAAVDGHGVAGPAARDGLVARGAGRRGRAATSAHIAAGNRRAAIEASRDNPYFRRMYRRIDQVVVFPRKLAIAMEQGEVVARFTLHADGHIGDLEIAKSSGFEDFDTALVRALEAVAPFGEVPRAVLAGADRVTVVTPYAFRNPLIR